MNSHKNGLLLASERRHVDQRLKFLGEDRVRDGEELLLASTTYRAHFARDSLIMSTLGMGVLALAVAVVIGSLASSDAIAVLLIGYLLVAGLLGTVTLIAIRLAVTAEVVRVVVDYRLELRRVERRARAESSRATDIPRAAGRRSLRALLGLG